MKRRVLHVAALAIALSVVIAACGQKPGVYQAGGFDGGTGTGGTTTGTTETGGTTTGTTGTGGTTTGTTGGTTGTTGAGGTTTAGTTTGGPVGPGDRTGITPTEIVIGVHAPTTGAAPVQGKAFEAGVKLYWDFLHKDKGQTIHGRKVRVIFANDNYNPTQAVAVCNKMASGQKAFLLIGGAGTDQIRACANFSNGRGIPYLSAGVQESGLQGLSTYFAVTMTYKQQMAPLMQLIKARVGKEVKDKYGAAGTNGPNGKIKVGHVRPNSSNFNDAADALRAAAQAAGFDYQPYPVQKEGSSGEAQTVAAQMERDGVDVVVPITAPTFTTQLAINTGKNNYKPLYAGVAISNNINQAINLACSNGEQWENALFFSPWPAWDSVMSGAYDPDFRAAANKYASAYNQRTKGGDILLALWGIMRDVHQMLLAAGKDVSRQSFVQTVSRMQVDTKVFPALSYTPSDRFGAKNVWVLRGDCSAQAKSGGQDGHQWVQHGDYPQRRSSF